MIILGTGTREGVPREKVRRAIAEHLSYTPERDIAVHGDAIGFDQTFKSVAKLLEVGQVKDFPASGFPTPLDRNRYMVDIVVEAIESGLTDDAVVIAFANKWASGTGQCARYARANGLTVVDYGVSTDYQLKEN